MLKIIKFIVKVIIYTVAIVFVGSFYLMNHYKHNFQQITHDARIFNKSNFWKFRQHFTVIFTVLFLLAVNCFFWIVSILLIIGLIIN